jgi:hypothetical protein
MRLFQEVAPVSPKLSGVDREKYQTSSIKSKEYQFAKPIELTRTIKI